jgi:pimeloyl-ACP methyl ester carboxylesterase
VSEALGAWSETSVTGHACEVFEPHKPSEHGNVVLYLHGRRLRRLSQSVPFTRELARRGLRAIAPFTGRCWWTDKLCPDFDAQLSPLRHLVDNVLPHIAERWGARPPRIALLGTGMGGQGALTAAFRFPNQFPIVAAVGPSIDYQLLFYDDDEPMLPAMYADAESARQDTATLHVHPLNWPRNTWFAADPADGVWYEGAERLRMKLSALGVPHECDLETSAGGYDWPYYELMAPRAMEFIAGRLEHERLRV